MLGDAAALNRSTHHLQPLPPSALPLLSSSSAPAASAAMRSRTHFAHSQPVLQAADCCSSCLVCELILAYYALVFAYLSAFSSGLDPLRNRSRADCISAGTVTITHHL